MKWQEKFPEYFWRWFSWFLVSGTAFAVVVYLPGIWIVGLTEREARMLLGWSAMIGGIIGAISGKKAPGVG